ncbi:bacteriohemerythrin [Massilia sp. DD77]|uniref:bacteriohemerythrin n=1 Tax=Massilia sp. DD77 TaxID=3109349 RepID=UPI002FFDF2C8
MTLSRIPPRRIPFNSTRAICAAIRHARKHLCSRLLHAASAPDEGFVRAFPSLVAAVEAGFRHEEMAMEALGYASLHEHRAENATLLSALHRAASLVEAGDVALGRQVLAALRDLLSLHRLTTDLALAMAARPTAARLRMRVRGRPLRAAQLHHPRHAR